MLIAQLSDPHLKLDDDTSQPALARAAEVVAAFKPDAVLLTGDIADTGDPEEHELATRLLAPIQAPVYTAAGNHDRFEGRHQYVADLDHLRLIVCDTSQPGRDDGALDLEWLEAQLVATTPTIIAMHHPPFELGITWLDEIGLPQHDRAALAALLDANRQVVRVVAGHVHRTAMATLGGCAIVTCTSTNIQAKLDFESPDAELVSEPPSVLLHALQSSGQVVTHVQPV
ncbi:metallophosphoesterase [Solirubrobacter taibaiensis]|nr:metallophosphoesterase [Solirubrobacter taibaiensis]